MVEWYVYLVFVLGLIGVIKGGDWFVEAAAWFAKKLGIAEVIIGATVVSMGTTLPETMIASMGAWQGRGSVVVGTALGSILCNTGLILGITNLLRPTTIKSKDTLIKMAAMMGAVVLLGIVAWNGSVSRWDSLIFLAFFVLYIRSNVLASRGEGPRQREPMDRRDIVRYGILFGVGLVMVVGGARALLDSGVILARSFGISEMVIAATLFAVGSSLPEVVTSVTAALKGYSGLALGNVIGANTLNVLMVSSIAGMTRPFTVERVILTQDIPIALLLMGVVTIPAFFSKKIGRAQGLAALVLYGMYIAWLLYRG